MRLRLILLLKFCIMISSPWLLINHSWWIRYRITCHMWFISLDLCAVLGFPVFSTMSLLDPSFGLSTFKHLHLTIVLLVVEFDTEEAVPVHWSLFFTLIKTGNGCDQTEDITRFLSAFTEIAQGNSDSNYPVMESRTIKQTLVLLFLLEIIYAYNLASTRALTFRGSNGTYFGYSLATKTGLDGKIK